MNVCLQREIAIERELLLAAVASTEIAVPKRIFSSFLSSKTGNRQSTGISPTSASMDRGPHPHLGRGGGAFVVNSPVTPPTAVVRKFSSLPPTSSGRVDLLQQIALSPTSDPSLIHLTPDQVGICKDAVSGLMKKLNVFHNNGRVIDREFDILESLLKEIEQALGSPIGKGPQLSQSKPLVVVISGPSGVGKDAVISRLKETRDEIHFVVTATTRARRPGEQDGKDYFFVTREEFNDMIQKDELLEHAVVYGDFKGIPKKQVRDCLSRGYDCVLRVDVQGAATIRSIMGSGAVFIFLVAESEAALVKRLVERKTETKEKLLLRIAAAREELKRINEFDYVVVNVDGQLERTVSLISHIIDAEKARVHQREVKL